MNSLIIFPEEIRGNIASIQGAHLEYVLLNHSLACGAEVKIGILNGQCGYGTVKSVNPSEIILEITLDKNPLEREDITLIVAIPRPQTQKKIVHLATVLGVKKLYFIRSERSNKSYLQAKTLNPESIKYEIVKGLEQACDSVPPVVDVYPLFKPFLEDVLVSELDSALDSSRASLKVLCDPADPDAANITAINQNGNDSHRVVAIGPELGWNDYERGAFKEMGFNPISLGPRILRCETATAVILAHLIKC